MGFGLRHGSASSPATSVTRPWHTTCCCSGTCLVETHLYVQLYYHRHHRSSPWPRTVPRSGAMPSVTHCKPWLASQPSCSWPMCTEMQWEQESLSPDVPIQGGCSLQGQLLQRHESPAGQASDWWSSLCIGQAWARPLGYASRWLWLWGQRGTIGLLQAPWAYHGGPAHPDHCLHVRLPQVVHAWVLIRPDGQEHGPQAIGANIHWLRFLKYGPRSGSGSGRMISKFPWGTTRWWEGLTHYGDSAASRPLKEVTVSASATVTGSWFHSGIVLNMVERQRGEERWLAQGLSRRWSPFRLFRWVFLMFTSSGGMAKCPFIILYGKMSFWSRRRFARLVPLAGNSLHNCLWPDNKKAFYNHFHYWFPSEACY